MKKNIALPMLIASSVFAISTSKADPQNLNFYGEIASSTCYHTNGPEGTPHSDITRFLSTVSVHDLSQTGQTTDMTYLTIYFRCPDGTPIDNPNMRLVGRNVTPSGALGNVVPVASGGAENVSLQVFEFPNGGYPYNLLNFSNGQITTTGSYEQENTTTGEIYYEYLMGVRYFAEFGPAKPGIVRGIIERAVHYQ